MENLLNKKGWEFECKISGTPVKGKIQVEDGTAYLCQNERDGEEAGDKLSYNYSWGVKDGSEPKLRDNGVSDFRLIPMDPKTYKDWQVGDKVQWNDCVWEVILRSGEVVVCKDENNDGMGNYTCEELYRKGGRLIVEEEDRPEIKITELTLEQVASLAGIPVEQLRIKEK